MRVRALIKEDAPRILSWIKDPEINRFFLIDSNTANLDSILLFIEKSQSKSENLHLAVTDDNDYYLGTISLKNIDYEARNAEYAISLCRDAHGTGAARFATIEILRIAFDELDLNRVYLNVLSDNIKAIKFYEKSNFIFEGEFKEHLLVRGELRDLKWFRILKKEYKGNFNSNFND